MPVSAVDVVSLRDFCLFHLNVGCGSRHDTLGPSDRLFCDIHVYIYIYTYSSKRLGPAFLFSGMADILFTEYVGDTLKIA